MTTRKDLLRGARIDPMPVTGRESVADLVDNAFLAYNAGRLAEGCRLFAERMLADDVTVGMSLTGAMTPAGLGMSTIIPLIEAGFLDWIVSTGANLYHDAHFGIGLAMHKGSPFADERVRRATMMTFDRDLAIETLGNTKQFESAGLPTDKRYDSAVWVDAPAGWWLDPSSGPKAMMGLAIGTLIGGSLQFLVQLPALRRVGYVFHLDFQWRDPGVKQILRLMGPSVIAAATTQVNVLINSVFASDLGDGPTFWLSAAFRLMQLPLGLFGVALGTVALPLLARMAATGRVCASSPDAQPR